MVEERVETGVDRLIGLLQHVDRIPLAEAAQKLGIPEDTIQLWVDFLAEEHIVGIDYKFTKPFIFLNKKTEKKVVVQEEAHTLEHFKEQFSDQAKKKQIPESQIPQLWQAHLQEAIDKQKDYFIREARKKNLSSPEKLFELYQKRLLAV